MTLPAFNDFDGNLVINKTSFEQWKKDVGGSFTGQPEFKTLSLARGSQVWVVTQDDFQKWLDKQPPATPVEPPPVNTGGADGTVPVTSKPADVTENIEFNQ